METAKATMLLTAELPDGAELENLFEFVGLIDKPVPIFKWFEGPRAGEEPPEYEQLRLLSSLIYRLELYRACGLPRIKGSRKLLRNARRDRDTALVAWKQRKAEIDKEHAARGTRPPWW